jgi:riboflavin kinase/FMN adenylyltransferase
MSAPIHATSLEALSNHGFDKVVLAIGVFDGVHKGHQSILARLREMAGRLSARPVALTFHPHPRSVLRLGEPILLLTSPERKMELLAAEGVEAVVRFPFSKEFAELSAEDFLEDCLLAPDVEVKGVCVGSKWRFGHQGKGDRRTLEKYAKAHGFEFHPVEELVLDGTLVSSTAIRRAVAGGRLEDAAKMLGRRHAVSGKVVEGDSIGRSVLETPTANLLVSNEILPPPGVYACLASMEGVSGSHPAAVFIGDSPTFRNSKRHRADLEAHIIDFEGDLRGRKMLVEFVERIRETRSFPLPKDLKTEMEKDVGKTREIIGRLQRG